MADTNNSRWQAFARRRLAECESRNRRPRKDSRPALITDENGKCKVVGLPGQETKQPERKVNKSGADSEYVLTFTAPPGGSIDLEGALKDSPLVPPSGVFVLGTNGSGLVTFISQSAVFGLPGVALVSPSGNDMTATVGGGTPFATIKAALAAVTTLETVFVLPGVYNETKWPLVVPAGVSVTGISFGDVIITALANVSGTFIEMQGPESVLQNVIVNFQTQASPGALNLTGVSMAAGGSILGSEVAVSEANLNPGGGNLTGVLISGGPGEYDSFNIDDSVVAVVSIGAGNKVGILGAGAGSALITNSDVLMEPTGTPTLVVAFQTTGGTHYARASSFNGSTTFGVAHDVLQTGGNMILEYCTLANANSGLLGFSCIGASKTLTFGVITPVSAAEVATPQGLYLGGGATTSSPDPDYPMALIPEAMVVRGMTINCVTAPGAGVTDQYNLVITSVASSIITATVVGASVVGSTFPAGVSETIPAGAKVGVQLVSNFTASGSASAATKITVTLFLY